MCRRLLLLVILVLSFASVGAQTQIVSLSGQLRSGAEPVAGAVVALLQPSDSSLLTYTISDSEGRYRLQLETSLPALVLRVRSLGFKRRLLHLKAQSQTLDLNLEHEERLLREVIVKAHKLWAQRDTLNYLVSAYTLQQDRTIGDVLQRLPGITIEDNKVIKYQGLPINRFYIEGLDLLRGRYGLATQGIRAQDIATVQVLEHHQPVRALEDQQASQQAAINLKLKDRAKGIWSKALRLGAGGYAPGPLWDASLQAMHFGKKRQHLLRYSSDNLGQEFDDAVAHYGGFTSEDVRLLGLVVHGRPPVGNGLFGYRHRANLSTLIRLADSASLSYNLHYRHQLSHGSSFAKTTYLLPEGAQLQLTEDISDRTRSHAAELQLNYEKNRTLSFFSSTFFLSGAWDEGHGEVHSTSIRSPLVVGAGSKRLQSLQTLRYRSLRLSNRTRWVHRTAGGAGFEWSSTNSLSSTPQALSLEGSKTARQNLGVSSYSSVNRFELLGKIQSRRWTLSATGHLDATYTTLHSQLSHPDIHRATQGKLSHLDTRLAFGPVARYSHGALQGTLSLPLALGYTALDNAPIQGESNDAQRLRLYLQPSLSLIWKASDSYSLEANASYSTSETPWRQLLSATVMQSYRSLSRYRATLHDSHTVSADARLSYRDLFSRIFAHIGAGWHRSWSDIAYGTTLDDEGQSLLEASYMPHHSERYTLSAYGRKDIDWQTMQLALSATLSHAEQELLRQGDLMSYRALGYSLQGSLGLDLVQGYRLEYDVRWQGLSSHLSGRELRSNELNQRLQLTLDFLPARLQAKLHAKHCHNSGAYLGRRDFLFLGASLSYRPSKQVELVLDGDNLSDIRSYTIRRLEPLEEYWSTYHLRPRSLILSLRLSL
ncbi:MAG: carboxypeptidase-like regulatory domain-containing protein [Porphyromonas sp.]